jgi:ubiquinol-cytochrome c reductase iron-sulfur subunit
MVDEENQTINREIASQTNSNSSQDTENSTTSNDVTPTDNVDDSSTNNVDKSSDSQSSDSESPETKEPETKEPETKEPETKEPETKEPETKEPETKEPEPVLKERRNFLKIIAVAGGILGLTPFIPYGSFFTATLGGTEPTRQKIMTVEGAFANVNDMEPDSAIVFPYPRTGDAEKDAEPFRRYQLIRLASDAGGDANDVSSLRIYSMVCVHLWCLWDYIEGREIEVDGEKLTGNIECPCHGSNYDPRTGISHKGPAMLQSKPNDALPTLPVEVDEKGDIWVLPPDTALDKNGVVGMGRYVEL